MKSYNKEWLSCRLEILLGQLEPHLKRSAIQSKLVNENIDMEIAVLRFSQKWAICAWKCMMSSRENVSNYE